IVSEITQEEYTERRGEDGEEDTRVKRTKFKLHSKLGALDKIGQHLGMFTQQHEHKHSGTISHRRVEDLSPMERQQRLLAIADELEQRSVN
ncbi:hypothetical protein LCGC14_1867510, partial [marine sediment metagenome]